MRPFVIIGVAAVLLSACMRMGVQVTEEQLARFEEGKTTMQEVVSALGQPTGEHSMRNGTRAMTYMYNEMKARPESFIPYVGGILFGGFDQKSSTATLVFDRTGVLKSVTTSSGATGFGMGLSPGGTGAN